MKLHGMLGPRDQCGAALVEFALILPVFMMLVLGMFSGGQSYDRKLSLTSSAREGARYGATLPETQVFTPAITWAQAVQGVIVERSAGVLTSAQVCVALVTGGSGGTALGTNWSTDGVVAGTAGNCFGSGTVQSCARNDNAAPSGSYTGKRVHVCVARTSKLQLLFTSMNLNLQSSSNARFEG